VGKEFLEQFYKSMVFLIIFFVFLFSFLSSCLDYSLFQSSLKELANRIDGRTLLFIPREDVSKIEKATLDKDLLQRLETCLIHWRRQIK
jgi:hypothetical protein